MDCAIDGNIVDELNNTSGLERGIRLLQAAEGVFKETTIQARTVIDWIISKYEKPVIISNLNLQTKWNVFEKY